jgi:DNA polymerase III subunit gamma/tau
VDDARELRERAPTAPALGREKVYILDEAQRLSREAFDALLKLFEEPPQGVRFVLCTTEPHKMPATIVGRCQRFDFRRITGDVLAAHLIDVARSEGVELSEPVAHAIARQSEGSARDALSLLDQATVLGGAEISEEVLEQLLGSPRQEVQYAIADAVAVGDTSGVFAQINALVQEGQDVRHVTSECLLHFRNLLLANTAPGQADLVDVTSDEYERVRAQAAKFQPRLRRCPSRRFGSRRPMSQRCPRPLPRQPRWALRHPIRRRRSPRRTRPPGRLRRHPRLTAGLRPFPPPGCPFRPHREPPPSTWTCSAGPGATSSSGSRA